MRIIYFDENMQQVDLDLDVNTKSEAAYLLGTEIAKRSQAKITGTGCNFGIIVGFIAFILFVNQIFSIAFLIVLVYVMIKIFIFDSMKRRVDFYNNSIV